jgi:hypothetical protein
VTTTTLDIPPFTVAGIAETVPESGNSILEWEAIDPRGHQAHLHLSTIYRAADRADSVASRSAVLADRCAASARRHACAAGSGIGRAAARFDEIRDTRVPLAIGLAFKLLLGPLLLAGLYVGLLHMTGNVARVTLFESAVGPQIGASIVAIQHGLNPPLITLLVGIGITLSFLTLPMWWYFLQGI